VIILQAALGDLIVQALSVPSLDPSDPIPVHYSLHFHDVPTGRTASFSCASEAGCVTFFAAWLMADEEKPGPQLTGAAEALRAGLPAWCMP
jgi:hypothetical protein